MKQSEVSTVSLKRAVIFDFLLGVVVGGVCVRVYVCVRERGREVASHMLILHLNKFVIAANPSLP